MEHELLEDADRCLREVSVAEGDQEVALHLNHDFEPCVQILITELLLDCSVKDLNVTLFKDFKTFGEDNLLKVLRNEKGIPFKWGTVSSVLFCVGT